MDDLNDREKRNKQKLRDSNTHGIADNMWFYAKIWAKTFPLGLVMIPVFAVVGILFIYEKVSIPRVLLEVLETQGDIGVLLMALVLPALALIFSKTALTFLLSGLMSLGSRPMVHLYSVSINEKMFGLHYQTLIDSAVQTKLSKAKKIAMGGDGNSIHFFGVILGNLLTAVAGAVLFSSGIMFVNPLLFFVILVSALIHFLNGMYVGKYVERSMRDRSDDEKKENYVMRVLEDRLYAKDIRMYGIKQWLYEKFVYYHDRYSKYLRGEIKVRILAGLINCLLVLVRDVVAYAYLIYMLTEGVISVSVFVFLLGLVFQFSAWMDLIVEQINSLITFSTMMNQVREFLDVEDGVIESAGDMKESDVADSPSIEFRNVSFRYGVDSKWIFRDFSLKINGGERIALVGINGAGKTTLMLILMGLFRPTEGDVLIDGKSYKDFRLSEYYKLFAPLFQDIVIFPESILDNVTFGANVDPAELSAALELSGLNDIIAELPDAESTFLVKNSQDEAVDLSGGQNQRLLLARVILKNSKIIILDEPTAALDPIAESRIYEEYSRITENNTSVFISHRLASTKFCDKIILLEYGKILESGTHDELMRLGGRYCEMYNVQSRYYKEEGSLC